MISDEDKNRVRAATDLVALVQETVELRPRGHEFWGCCPFHGEKTPSFHIIPATQVWHCFGCGEGGDCFTYIMKRENLSFPESIRYLAERAGIELQEEASFTRRGTKRARLVEVCEATCDFYHTMLMRGKDGRGREYFASRGLGSDVCQRYRLGFAPGRGALVNHLRSQGFSPREMIDANVAIDRRGGLADRFYDRDMFPIFDEQGKCIAFGGRIMGAGEPKYLNTSETPLFHKKRNLYGFNWAKEHIVAANEAIVVEGYTDAIACWEGGIKNVVATLGTALTEHHVKTLTRFAKKIIYLFDGDNAGQKAAERAIQFVETGSIDLRCVILPDNMDPNDYVNAKGGSALRQLLDESEPLLDFVFRKLEQRADASTPAGRARALEDACRLIYPLRASYMMTRILCVLPIFWVSMSIWCARLPSVCSMTLPVRKSGLSSVKPLGNAISKTPQDLCRVLAESRCPLSILPPAFLLSTKSPMSPMTICLQRPRVRCLLLLSSLPSPLRCQLPRLRFIRTLSVARLQGSVSCFVL